MGWFFVGIKKALKVCFSYDAKTISLCRKTEVAKEIPWKTVMWWYDKTARSRTIWEWMVREPFQNIQVDEKQKKKNSRKPVLEQNKQYCRYATVFCRFLLGWSVCFLWKLCVYPVILSIALTTCGLGSHFIDFILKKLIISKKLCCQRSIIEASSCYFYFSLFRSRSHSRTGEIISVYRPLHTRVILRIFTTWRVFEKTQLWQVFKPRIPPFFRHVKG